MSSPGGPAAGPLLQPLLDREHGVGEGEAAAPQPHHHQVPAVHAGPQRHWPVGRESCLKGSSDQTFGIFYSPVRPFSVILCLVCEAEVEEGREDKVERGDGGGSDQVEDGGEVRQRHGEQQQRRHHQRAEHGALGAELW